MKIEQANHLESGGSHALSKLGQVEGKSSTSDVLHRTGSFRTLPALPAMCRYECLLGARTQMDSL